MKYDKTLEPDTPNPKTIDILWTRVKSPRGLDEAEGRGTKPVVLPKAPSPIALRFRVSGLR